MIRVEELTLGKFRGVKQLTLSPEKLNFAVCGNNGTGKSGVVDGIEFALTGNITRLTGKGSGGLSLKTHGPHVDARDQPQNAFVALRVFLPAIKKSVTIERHVHNPKEFKLTPDEREIREAVEKLADHPEFALSRREILKYVLTEPGERSREVQALLKLDEVEKVRASLQSLANSCKTEAKKQENDATLAKNSLLAALRIEELKLDQILNAVNERRKVLALNLLNELGKDTSIKTDIDAPKGATQKPKVNKTQALIDVDKLTKTLLAPNGDAITDSIATILSVFGKLEESATLLLNLKRQTFLKTGFDLIDENICPLCDNEWDPVELRALLSRKLNEAAEADKLKKELDSATIKLRLGLRELAGLVSLAEGHGRILEASPDMAHLTAWATTLRGLPNEITSLENIFSARTILEKDWKQIPATAPAIIETIRAKIEALPDASKEDEARDFLVLGQERLEVYRKARRQEELWKSRCEQTTKAASLYGDTSKAILTGIYNEVEKDFSRYYQLINHEDEANFQGKLTPALGKLGFEVDFYGRGFFPPGAYHSEGHQDGMGLCLYLALMKRILGAQFTFAVLDDVLMSVDAGHRKEVCKLLKTEFAETQFIFTTHDDVWLQHMLTERLATSKSVVKFRKWTVQDGPMVWNHQEVWAEISADLDRDDVPGASHSLRRFLEFISQELADKLKAPVEFRSGGGYDLGDLLPQATGRFGALLAKAKDVASSWNQRENVEQYAEMHKIFRERLVKTQVEQWAINKTVHYNAWAKLQKEDFQPVVDSFKTLLEFLKCKTCDVFLFVSPSKGNPDVLRCDCGGVTINLKKKD